jgi:NCS1 family nucleobase:cation symporter-1
MLVASAALVIWALVQVPSGQLFDLPAKVVEGGPKTWAALTGLVGFWAVGVEHSDFTVLPKAADQVTVRRWMPIPMALFSVVGIIGFSAHKICTAKPRCSLTVLLAQMGTLPRPLACW